MDKISCGGFYLGDGLSMEEVEGKPVLKAEGSSGGGANPSIIDGDGKKLADLESIAVGWSEPDSSTLVDIVVTDFGDFGDVWITPDTVIEGLHDGDISGTCIVTVGDNEETVEVFGDVYLSDGTTISATDIYDEDGEYVGFGINVSLPKDVYPTKPNSLVIKIVKDATVYHKIASEYIEGSTSPTFTEATIGDEDGTVGTIYLYNENGQKFAITVSVEGTLTCVEVEP